MPIQVWASKGFAYRWLGTFPDRADVSLKDDGTAAFRHHRERLKRRRQAEAGVASRTASWSTAIRSIRSASFGPASRSKSARRDKLTLKTYMSGEWTDSAQSTDNQWERRPYDKGGQNMADVLRQMMFYDAAGGQNHTHLANDYQEFADLSGLLKAGRAVLVAMPPQDGSCRGADLFRSPVPPPAEKDPGNRLGNALDRHTTCYRFIFPDRPRDSQQLTPEPVGWTLVRLCNQTVHF